MTVKKKKKRCCAQITLPEYATNTEREDEADYIHELQLQFLETGSWGSVLARIGNNQ